MQSTEQGRPRLSTVALLMMLLQVVSIIGTLACYALAILMSDFNLFSHTIDNPFVYAIVLFALASPLITLILALVRKRVAVVSS